MKTKVPAGKFMGDVIRELATRRPDLCNGSGYGFWPVPAFFPKLLTHCLNTLQHRITGFYLSGQLPEAEMLTRVRMDLMRIVYEGDLGENHIQLFIEEHSLVCKLSEADYKALPFYHFCSELLKIEDPIFLLGAVTRNEEGSTDEIHALVETGLIRDGIFSQTHFIEEEEHAIISEEIANCMQKEELFCQSFIQGRQFHDKLYNTVLILPELVSRPD